MAKQTKKGQSIPVSLLFNVSPKTVRDIWNRKTWPNATCSLWSQSEVVLSSQHLQSLSTLLKRLSFFVDGLDQ